MTIRNKIVFHFGSLTVLILLLLGLFIYHYTKQYNEREFFQRMITRAGVAGKAKFEADSSNLSFYNEIRDNHLQRLSEEKEYFFATPADAVRALPALSKPGVLQLINAGQTVELRDGQTHYVGIWYKSNKGDSLIFLSAVNKIGGQLLSNLAHNLLIGFFIAIALVLGTSYLLAMEVVNPIRNIIRNARNITASNLHLRLPATKPGSEISDLTQTFNDMLDRLETSFETQNNFLNKAAHELRTPLTAILGEAELALSKQRTGEAYRQALTVIANEAEQMQHHTSSLLELAQAGYNAKTPFMELLRMDELLFSVKRLVDSSDPGNQVRINLDELPEAEERITIRGNANLLRLAIANIIQNACKYSEQKPVGVLLQATETHCIMTVKDDGIGIPEKELKYIFDPFFRASNTGSFKGYGVGLPLAQKIIRLHRGELHYASRENEGTVVTIQISLV